MANINKATRIDGGLSLEDDLGIFHGANDPSSGLGEVAPIGSLFLRTNGQFWQKIGIGDTAWTQLSNAASASLHFQGHNNGVTQTFSTPTTINFSTTVRSDAAFSEAVVGGGTEVTINTTGWYEIAYSVSSDNTSGSRTVTTTHLDLNTGGGFNTVPGTISFGYHRNASRGESTSTAVFILNISAGDIIRISSVSTGSSVVTAVGGCRLNIKSISGP